MASARASKYFDRVSNAVGVSSAGRSWLIASIDPFHDEPIMDLRGLPDGTQAESVVQVVRQTLTVKCPSSVTSGTWDCHIQSIPISQVASCSNANWFIPDSSFPTQNPLSVVSNFATNAHLVGPINLTTAPTGSAAVSCLGSDSYLGFNVIGIPENYIKGTYRVIARGWEVISAGPQLYKSGTVYTYGIPAPDSQISQTSVCVTQDSTGLLTETVPLSLRWFPYLPLTLSDANLVPNCQSWEAKDGVYVVDKMSDIDQATFAGSGIAIMYQSNTLVPGANMTDGGTVWAAGAGQMIGQPDMRAVKFANGPSGQANVEVNVFPGVGYTAYDHSGSYFTGLSLQDVLVCNAIFYIERLPGAENQDLQVLAKPCPPLDQQALEMYSIIMSEMPKGMVQKANGFGDWFKDAASLVIDNVAPALAALPGPLGAVGKGVTVAGGLMKAIMPKNSQPSYSPGNYSENPRSEFRNEINQEINSELKNSKGKKKPKGLLNQVSPLGKKKLKKLIKKDVKKDMRKL